MDRKVAWDRRLIMLHDVTAIGGHLVGSLFDTRHAGMADSGMEPPERWNRLCCVGIIRFQYVGCFATAKGQRSAIPEGPSLKVVWYSKRRYPKDTLRYK